MAMQRFEGGAGQAPHPARREAHGGCAEWLHVARAQVFAQTVRDKGVAGLFTGMGPRVTQTALMSAVFFSLFEFWKGQLKRCAPPGLAPLPDMRFLAVPSAKKVSHMASVAT